MEKQPLVSVVLCTYNDEQYIRETIDSVLCQTFSDFEFIIWNDGSTDGTEQIIKSYDDSRIRYFYHENTGVGMAAQLACSKTKGKYIARIDGDDICLPQRLKYQVDYLEAHPDYVVVASPVYYIDDNGKELGRSFPATSAKVIQRVLKSIDPIAHPSSMYRRDAYLQSGGYIGIRQREDYFLFGRLSKIGRIKNLRTPLIKYRIRGNSLSHYMGSTSYDKILKCYRDKIISDDKVLQEDIDLYNAIFLLSKQLSSNRQQSQTIANQYEHSLEERLYKMLKSVIGDETAERIVCLLKNVYCGIKY
jgi:glycosyltransferase involved in cell wall biosynthesis